MSRETMTTLNTLQLIGNVAEKGRAWHWDEMYQGEESNHYDGMIPPEDVRRRLFHWTAEEAPVQYTRPETITLDGVTPAETVTDDTRKVIYRSDTGAVLGVFSASYERHQFTDTLLDNVAGIIGDGLGIGSAGLLDGGAIGYVQVEMPGTVVLADGADYKPYLLAMSSHNGKRATGYQLAVQRVVCDNTLNIAAAEKGGRYKIKHTRYSALKIRDAREALGIIATATDTFAEEVQEFLSVKVDEVQWQHFLDKFVPFDPTASKRSQTMSDNKRGELNRLYKHDERVAPWNGTAWGVYQAVNTYDQHHAIARGLGEGNQAVARKGRSLLALSGGDLDKQVDAVRATLAAVV
jgi:phage/plasmid-like protein (TIGR03299 family)